MFVLIPFSAITKGSWNLGSPVGLSGLSLGSGSAEPTFALLYPLPQYVKDTDKEAAEKPTVSNQSRAASR